MVRKVTRDARKVNQMKIIDGKKKSKKKQGISYTCPLVIFELRMNAKES